MKLNNPFLISLFIRFIIASFFDDSLPNVTNDEDYRYLNYEQVN